MSLTITCDNKESIPLEKALMACFGKDSSGRTFLRVIISDATVGGENNDAYDCNKSEVMSLDILLRLAIRLDGDGKPALYLGESSF